MNRPETELPELVVGQLILRCSRQVDRIAHAILWRDGEHEYVIMQSVEGDSSQFWPESPPLQEVVPHFLDEHPAALLAVGKSGSGHWSASIQASSHPPHSIEFDIACRSPESVSWLGSTYRLGTRVSLMDSPSMLESKGTIELIDASSGRIYRIEALEGRSWTHRDRLLQISCDAPNGMERFPYTFRWRYRFTF